MSFLKNLFISTSNRSVMLKKNILAMFLIKGISMIISFLYVPLLLNSMTSGNYAIWLTLTSMVSWISIFDIGFGNGLRNKLAEALAKGDKLSGRIYVSTAYVSMGFMACILCVVFFLTYNFVNWSNILNAIYLEESLVNSLVLIVFCCFILQFVLGIINSILYALQLPAYSSFLAMLGQLLSFIIVVILVKLLNITSLFLLCLIISIVPLVVLLFFSIFLFRFKFTYLSPSLKYFNKAKIKDIMSLGVKFFIIQIATIILFQTNNLIITHVVGSDAVVEYNVVYKYMHILLMLFTLIATPLWSASTDAYVRNDFVWIKNINSKLLKVVTILTCVGFLMVLVSPFFYKLWLNSPDVNIGISTTIILFIYFVFMMLYGCYGYILNGIGKLKVQIYITFICSILYIPLAIYAGRICGLQGVLVVFTIVAVINYIWSKIQLSKILNGTAQGIWNK